MSSVTGSRDGLLQPIGATSMTSAEASAGDLAQRQVLLPHVAVNRAPLGRAALVLAGCPRCRQLIALPNEVRDGDLTECLGQLMRVTYDQHGYHLDAL